MKYFILAFKNWNKFNGRANRSEYWYFVLFYFLIVIILYYVDISFLGYNPMNPTSLGVTQIIFNLLVLIPSLSVTVRRLHDVNKSGWNMLWNLLPIIGTIYIIYLNILKGGIEDNSFGSPSNA
ncbi:MAG: DUF805 domain-containing protein [Flavobacteriaceae bacterium]|nr:hypothetical protein [Flavobacteriaceae bacterium]